MRPKFKSIDAFTKNIAVVFVGTSLTNFCNLLYQLLIAHKFPASDFAAFNSLLSIFMLVSAPLGTLQIAVVKYCSEFNARGQIQKLKFLLSDLFRKTLILAVATAIIFWAISPHILTSLKISSVSSGYILALLLALMWLSPVLSGGIQGLEFFAWFAASSVVSGALKLGLAFIFIIFGYNIAGVLGALLISTLISLIIFYFPLRPFISLKIVEPKINYRDMLTYLLPVAISYFCFVALVNMDMILVKHYFLPEDAGLYSLAQMVGKIFLFLPAAISMVMLPRTSGLNAKNENTLSTLKKSLFYALGLCLITILFYNFFPAFVLRVLTGKAYPASILLGRIFSISMSFFAPLLILIYYFLSIKDLRFITYLVFLTLLQFLGIILFHQSLIGVQLILCINAILLFLIHLQLVYKGPVPVKANIDSS